ncbi:MAG: DUF2096 family protein [Methanosphaera sp.]|uniref:DUF2096 family protein n=1 Tax=Methanosphaera sp. TaxID=2666342 RepID=UPI0025D47710|nr:DUF2096 family protein [Methanosphaera sp.]MCI5866938.1 DUF2096 domain-containing protein [Methanosphaera sp.]MDD6535093.1 DUF2096 family protein [Methanosphaera sp.]MDY3955902.1 DUF2096 family protein [Methanosphaera sp.]
MDNRDSTQHPLYLKWTVLDHLLKVLTKTYEIPKNIIKDLQLARALTNFYLENPEEPDRYAELPRINGLLRDVEQYLMLISKSQGEEFVKEWEEKILLASQGKEVFKPIKIQSKFIAGMPANFDFVRFNFKEPIAEERFIEVCEYENVIIEFDDNDTSIFVFGEKPQITSALKELSPFFAEQM